MQSCWSDAEAARWPDPLGECVYGSRLLGADPDLVLHGGGNTSLKARGTDALGDELDILYVKGSGWDLATIEEQGFVALRLDDVRNLARLERLSDREMVNALRCARLDASAPDPSVEAIVHAIVPDAAVQHSHADAVVALTNTPDGSGLAREIYGDRVAVIPYVMPGFELARACALELPRQARDGTVGMVLLNHGLFTFGATTREAYERHVELVSLAEEYLAEHAGAKPAAPGEPSPAASPLELAELRRRLSAAAGRPLIVRRCADPRALRFVRRPDLSTVARRGPATPDHVVRTKRLPLVGRDVDTYVAEYVRYFDEHKGRAETELTMLDPAPRIVLDRGLGMLAAGPTCRDAGIARDIYLHTIRIIEQSEALGGYRALSAAELFEVEYWDLEQAKLRRAGPPPQLAGEVALVTGASSGIGRACAAALLERGAVVVGLDVAETVAGALASEDFLGIVADVTDDAAVAEAIATAVERFGGVDVVVAAAGVFPHSAPIADHEPAAWRRAMAVNVDSIAQLFAAIHPFLRLAPRGGRVVVIGSKNVAAPGPGASAYSASKAALNQLARVAALEWAADGIRVNLLHPDAVFDTGLWTPELLEERATRYGLTVEEYKRRNLLDTEITSRDVGELAAALVGPLFAKVTGAQIPIDGGSDRVI